MASATVVLIDLDDTCLPDRAASERAIGRLLSERGLAADSETIATVFRTARRRWGHGPWPSTLYGSEPAAGRVFGSPAGRGPPRRGCTIGSPGIRPIPGREVGGSASEGPRLAERYRNLRVSGRFRIPACARR